MSREQWKDLLEGVGVIAIVASLVFLAIEVRQSNEIGRLDAMQAMGADWSTVGIEMASSDHLPGLLAEVYAGGMPEDFSEEDNVRISMVLHGLDHNWEMRYNQLALDVLESGDFSYPMPTNLLLSSRYHRAIWTRLRPGFSEEFAVFWERRFRLAED